MAPLQAQTDAPRSLAFRPGTNGSFTFDTGALCGVLRTDGKSFGLQSVIHVASGRRLDAGNGFFGHYRVFTTGKRYGGGAWDWPSTARLTGRGAVEVLWPATDERPFDMRAVYRWITPTTLDLETSVAAKQNLPKFESFLASYFSSGFTNAMAAAGMESTPHSTPTYLPAVRPPQQDIQMDRLVAMARGYQPHLIVVDRTVGGRYENYRTPEQEVPEKPLPYVWETCMTMGDQWSFKPNDSYKSTHRLIHLLVDIVGKGGNFLLNVGPQPDGQLPDAAVERMKEIGAWLKVNGEAIYGTRPIAPYKSGQVVFTRKDRTIHAIDLTDNEDSGLPERVTLNALHPSPGSKVRLLGVNEPLAWSAHGIGQMTIEIPTSIRQSPPCRHAFVFQFEKAP